MTTGLSSVQVKKLLEEYGVNSIEEEKKRSFLVKFIHQFKDILTLLLFLAAGLSFFIGEIVDASLIAGIIIINALFKLYQENKAEESIQALKKITITTTRVIRDSKEMEIDSRYLVPDDIILIYEGVKIPADAVLIQAINLEVNEAILTGESLPVYKNNTDEIYTGTIIVKGRGVAKIMTTGMNTKLGQITGHLSKIEKIDTPLQRKLNSLFRKVGLAGVGASLLVLVLSSLQGEPHISAFVLAISLAVAIVPEGLPAVTTITLAIGVGEMAKKKAIVRRLESIEAIGSITMIATDKTGTLTTNNMRVKEVYVDDQVYEHSDVSTSSKALKQLLTNGILCSSATLVYKHDRGSWDILGDPTEGSLLLLAQDMQITPETERGKWQLISEVPFNSESKMMSVRVKNTNEEFIFAKGAPESIVARCDQLIIEGKEEKLTEEKKAKIEEVFNNWTKKGLRVLAFSSTNSELRTHNDVFIGMAAIHDPPRPEVKEAIQKAKKAGIKTVMITGDNEKTAEAIGVSIGMIEEGDLILTGKQIEESTDEELLKKLPKVKVFARTSSIHKSRIVSLYQKLGEIVAVTGDGVNDAIALKQADVGIAMGKIGTDVARETADIVITDDNFATIVQAVEEGRNIVRNLKNAIKYLFATNASEALSLIIGMIAGIPNLFYATQIVYVNLISDGIPALALAFSPREEHMMNKQPEKRLSLLNQKDTIYIFLVAFLATAIILSSYFIFESESIRKTAVFSVLAMVQSFIFIDLWLSHRSIHKSYRKLVSLPFILAFAIPIVGQYVIVTVPFLARLFKVSTVSIFPFIQFVIISAAAIIGIEFSRKISRYFSLH